MVEKRRSSRPTRSFIILSGIYFLTIVSILLYLIKKNF